MTIWRGKAALGLVAIFAATSAVGAFPTQVRVDGAPTTAEDAVVRSILAAAMGPEWADYEKTKGAPIDFTLGHADLNGDGADDLLVYLADFNFGYCGSAGCMGYALLAVKGGYAKDVIGLPNFYQSVTVLPEVHAGLHDLRFDDSPYVFVWNGTEYQ